MIHNEPMQGGHPVMYNIENPQIMNIDPQQYGGNVIVQHESGNRYAHFYNRLCTGLGITQIVIGVMAIVMNTVIYNHPTVLFFLSHGTWGGVFFIVTGSMGIAAGLVKNSCLIVTFMAMSITAVSFPAPNMLITSAMDLTFLNSIYTNNLHNQYMNEVGITMEALILVLSVIELVVGIISAAVCCHAVCCCKSYGIAGGNDIVEQAPLIEPANRYAHFYNRCCVGLGITQIVIGALVLFIGIAVLFLSKVIIYGTFGGIYFIVTGSLGTATGCTKTKCLIIVYLVMSIIAVSIFAPLTLLNAAILSSNNLAESLILALSVIELVVSAISVAVCCHAVCSCRSFEGDRSMGYIYNQNQQQALHNNGNQYIAMPSGAMNLQQPQCMTQQPGMYQRQPPFIAQQPQGHEQQQQGVTQQPGMYQPHPQFIAQQPQGYEQQPQGIKPQPPVYEEYAQGVIQQVNYQ